MITSDCTTFAGDAAVLETHPQATRVTTDASGRFVATARAKLNLGLRVSPVRPDGYHDIESWFVPISWYDTLAVTPGKPLELVITGRTEGIPTDPAKNLVGRAALKLAEAAGIEPRAKIELHKVLPPGGGLGGGSSDAAAALVALNAAWGLAFPDQRLLDIAAALGSDVPFFIHSSPAVCRGRGEIITPMRSYHALYAVLIVPPQGLATKAVFESFDAGATFGNLPRTDWCQCAAAAARQLSEILINDLEPAAFAIAPWLKQLSEQASRVVGQRVHMTGSGSTLFTLCDSAPAASDIHRLLTAELPGNTTCVPVRILRQR